MDPKIIGAIGLMMVCCYYLSVFMMGGGEETPDPVAFCDVAKTDWINSKLQNDGMPQTQGESLQNCKVPENLQARIQ